MALSDEALAEKHGLPVEMIQLLRQTRGTSNDGLEDMTQGGLRRALRRLSYPDAARARHQHLLKQARGDDGGIPPNALARAVTQLKTLRAKAPARARVAGLPVDGAVTPLALVGAAPGPLVPGLAGLAPQRWQWLGPGNIGGRTRAIVVHPLKTQRMLAASAGGGLWFTENGGARWDPVDDFMANLAVSCLAIDPTDPETVYAGTGEGFGNADALRGGGIFRIVGGNRWQQIAATKGFAAVNRIAVSRNGTTVLAATPQGLLRSIDAARATWTRVIAKGVADVKCHPTLSSRAVAGGSDDGQAYFSTNGGASWKAATHPDAWSGRVELAYARKNPNVVYASVQGQTGELWRSTDGGKTYQRRRALGSDGKPAAFLGDQGWYGNVLWAGDPTDENLVLVGGINLWRSTNGGDTMAEISTWWDSRSAHADHHAIVAHPAYDGVNNRCVFFGNDGGIYKADDLRQLGSEAKAPFVRGWTELNNNYGVTQFYGGAVHPGSGRIVAGAQDNGTLCLAPGADSEHWNSWFGGDGGWCAADPSDGQVFYGEYVFLNIHRNTDACTTSDTAGDRYISGQFWDNARGWAWKPVPFQIPDARTQDALFIAPFVLDARNPNRILAGGLSLWETTTAKAPNTPTSGPRWRPVKPSTGRHITAIAVSPASSDVAWVGHEDGAVYVSVNATSASPAWQRCDHVGAKPLTPTRYCTRVVPHPTDTLVAYLTFGGFVSGNVWVTRDGGKTWTMLGASLPAAPAHTLAIHPRKPQCLYLGSEVGLFGSEDGGATWSATNEGPANVSVDELFWSGQSLLCATHGRGMYRIDLSGV
jgi:photosystem II stability/assembly factor-like uncharacterized protein